MPRNLVVVESPAKAKTIGKYLGKDFTVLASMGHVRDLPKSDFGVAIDGGVEVTYEVVARAKKVVAEIRKAAKGAESIYLATDLDREGEAIAWHVAAAAKLPESAVGRVSFTEITPEAIREAFAHPRPIDLHLVDAQQARRVVDRIVGYRLSPVLWRKVRTGLSAGRVQSAALRLVVDREREIRGFTAVEYWTLVARLSKLGAEEIFLAKHPYADKQKLSVKSEDEATRLLALLEGAIWKVASVRRSEKRRNPPAPFTTSTLQQEASRKLGFGAKRTMAVAQQLYEGVELGSEGSVGLITYMRTDSVNIAESALKELAATVVDRYGKEYLRTTRYKTKTKGAQEAHEAVRPTHSGWAPESVAGHLDRDQLRLYTLIWQRAVASQMAPALYDQVSADIAAASLTFRASGSTVRFDGFMRAYTEGSDEPEEGEVAEGALPALAEGDALDLKALAPEQHFTQPPPRYTEAGLVKALEENGIGRPSTYAPTISTLLDRGYVRIEAKRLVPEEVGFVVTDFLTELFPKVVDLSFTAEMEESLDAVAEGARSWVPLVREFYAEVERTLEEKGEKVGRPEEPTEVVCPVCGEETGATMVKKWGRYGWFLSCSRFPDCRGIQRLDKDNPEGERAAPELTDVPCPKCGVPMQKRSGRFGPFLGCSKYPECKGIKSLDATLGITCPQCKQGELTTKRTKRGKAFYGCNRYPECDFALWELPAKCSECGGPIQKGTCLSCGHQEPSEG
ncbi:MAG: type I DNA topoisomerase [Actinomycetota bacterium]